MVAIGSAPRKIDTPAQKNPLSDEPDPAGPGPSAARPPPTTADPRPGAPSAVAPPSKQASKLVTPTAAPRPTPPPPGTPAAPPNDKTRADMHTYLKSFSTVVHATYATLHAQEQKRGIDFDARVKAIDKQIDGGMTVPDFKRAVSGLVSDFHDAHLQLPVDDGKDGFRTIPMGLALNDGTVRVSAIGDKLGGTPGTPAVGDEVRAIDGVPVKTIIDNKAGPNASDADRRRIADELLIRSASDRDGLPAQPNAKLDMVDAKGKAYQFTTPWGQDEPPFPNARQPLAPPNPNDKRLATPDCHNVPPGQALPGGICSYTFRHPDGYDVGVVRPDAFPQSPQWQRQLATTLGSFEKSTKAMVVDLRGNRGGESGDVVFAGTRMLRGPTPLQRTTPLDLPPAQKAAAEELHAMGEQPPRTPAEQRLIDPRAHALLQVLRAGPADPRLAAKSQSIDERAQVITPVRNGGYTHPILVLTDHGTVSSGELMADLLQSSGRAKVMGAPTPGNVGALRPFYIPNPFGFQPLSTAGSLTRRSNGQPFENVGVRPDFPYEPTERDLRSGNADYLAAIHQQLRTMLQGQGASLGGSGSK